MKRLIISGGTRGIGKALIEKFTENEFQVAFCGSNIQRVQAAEDYYLEKYNHRIKGFVADLTDPEQVFAFAKQAIDFLGGCDVLINNAGIFVPGSVEHETLETYTRQMAINVNAPYLLSKALIPYLKKGVRPHIFNMCSIASIVAYPDGSSYCISKFAALGLTKVLRQELLPAGVGVTAILPGATLTESWGDTSLPESRFISPENIANVIWSAYAVNENGVVEELIIRPIAGDI